MGEMLPVRLWVLKPSEQPLARGLPWGLLVPKRLGVIGDPGADAEWENSEPWTGCGVALALHPRTGDGWDLEDLLLRLSMSSRTMPVNKSAGSSRFARFTVSVLSCSHTRSHPKKERKSISMISRALRFLKECRGTAVSKGNSSYPLISLARWSGASLRQGIFVKEEYRYFRSASIAALAFSDFEADSLPRPKVDQIELMPDMTLRTLDTEWMESRSVLDRWGRLRNDTYAGEASV